jgi:ribokinase
VVGNGVPQGSDQSNPAPSVPQNRVRVAVVGHVEWVEFARVEHVPSAGEIVHCESWWEEPAGGGAVAAVQLARLSGSATLYTALGADALGRRAAAELAGLGVRVEAAFRDEPQRRAFTFVDEAGERTITVIGERMVPEAPDALPLEELTECDGVYFTGGDAHVLRAARRARVLVATPRALAALRDGAVELDALVGSGRDAAEHYRTGDLDPPPRLVVRTAGGEGGSFESSDGRRGRYAAAPLPGPLVDLYGCGDRFAAGLTFGLASGLELDAALELAARCGAACAAGRGAYAGQLRLA